MIEPQQENFSGIPRAIQFPIDSERTPQTRADRRIDRVSIDLPAPLDQDTLTTVLAVVLFRYTQQTCLPIDCLDNQTRLDVTVSNATTVQELLAQVQQIRAAATPCLSAGNVAIKFTDKASRAAYELHELQFEFQFAPQPQLTLRYRSALFNADSIQRLLQSFLAALAGFSADPTLTVAQLPILDAEQVRQLAHKQQGATAALPTRPLHEIFAEFARLKPAALVATSTQRQLSYGELDTLSNRLAHHLVGLGVGRDIPVAVCIRPSVDILIALLAIYKAGGVYLPLDPTHPENLIGLMLAEAQPRALLTHSSITAADSNIARFNMDSDWQRIDALPTAPPAVSVSLDDGAYLIYTSGTTGKPKGVLANHSNLIFYLAAGQHAHGLRETDVFCSIARFTFSISLFDLATPLLIGARVHIMTREEVLSMETLCATLQTVSVVHAGPSLQSSLFRYIQNTPTAPRSFPNVRHASTGGDLVAPAVMYEMQQVFPKAELFVIYGSTEVSCMGTTFEIKRGAAITRNFVGKPYPNAIVQVLDEQQNIVPFGVVGEICYTGPCITRGYLNRPDLTTEKYVTIRGQRFYRMGDLGRLHADGNLEILGRNDFQVQLRGMRVEPTGIENLVRDLKLAISCAVVLKHIADNDERLVAYVVAPRMEPGELRQTLTQHLPDYMVPQHVIALDALPVTANGKLDRRRLAEMPLQLAASTTAKTQPQTLQEKTVAEVYARLLGVGEVGLDDDFFALGGHSLLGVAAMQEISSRLGVKLPPHSIFECATVKFIAAAAAAGASSAQTRPFLLNTAMPGPKLFLLGGVHIYREFAKRLDKKCEAYGVITDKEVNLYSNAVGEYSVEQLAADYIDIIRRAQPQGPYYLLGFSFTGIIAYEATRQLTAAGETVKYLVLVDAVLPEWKMGWRFRTSQLKRALSVSPTVLINYLWWRLKSDRKLKLEADDADVRLFYGVNPHMRPQDRKLLDPLDLVRVALNAKTSGEYVEKGIAPYKGNVGLIMSTDRLRLDPLKSPTGGWAHYLKQRYDRCDVDTDHMHLLEIDPHAEQVANFIMTGIRRVG